MKTRKSLYLGAKIFLLASFCLALSPIAANSQLCMDASGDGSVDVFDISYMFSYLYRGGPPPPDPWSANVDGFEKITLADLCYISGRILAGYGPSACSLLYPPIQPITNSTLLLSHTQWLDSGVTNTIITLELANIEGKYLEGLNLVFDLLIGSDTASVDSIRVCRQASTLRCSAPKVDTVQLGKVVLTEFEPGSPDYAFYRYELYTTVTASLQRRRVSIEWTHASPAQASSPDSSLITMIIEKPDFSPFMFKIWEPVIICCFQDRGDLNGDGDDGNVLDLTHLVDYIFRGSGDIGNCPDEADINNDGDPATVLDLTALVDYIFRGGQLLSCYN